MSILSLILLAMGLNFSEPLWADDLIEEVLLGKSTSRQAAAAKKEIQDQLLQQVAIKHMQFQIGIDRFNQVSSNVRQKIFNSWERYILYLKSGPLKTTPQGFEMEIAMKVSPRNLREILHSEGIIDNKSSFRYKLNLRLAENDLKNIEIFKKELIRRVPDIKNMRERLLSRNERIYEIEAAISPQELAKRMGQIPWEQFRVHPIESGEAGLSIEFQE